MRTALLIAAGLLSAITSMAQLPLYLDDTKPVEERIEDALSRMTLEEKIAVIHAQSKFSAPGVPRLGFPDLWTDDGPHGVRPDVLWDEWEQAGQTNDYCVAFPALTCLAATWNPQMSAIYGKALGEEARYRGKDVLLGPGVNINRTPLGGRNFEYMGEDPYLASKMVVPYIQGIQQNGVAACVKHYALNNDEEYRHQVNVIVSDRALHEIYLPAFKAAVTEAGVWTIMGAYNLYNGQHNCHNPILLQKILRDKWGFDGVVISDWGGAHNTEEAIYNGLDLEMGTWTDGLISGEKNSYDQYHLAQEYYEGIKSGEYGTEELDGKVRNLLRLYYRTTMSKRQTGFLCSDEHYEVARTVADEGIVLLQNNDNLLPLRQFNAGRVLVVGENAIKPMTVGGGSSSLKAQREISPLEGLKAALSAQGVTVDYQRGYVGDLTSEYNGVTMEVDLSESRSADQLIADAVKAAEGADYVIIFGGLNKADYQDCEGHDRKQYELPYGQDRLITALASANKNLVYVNISGNAVRMPWTKEVPAIVQGWYLGSEAGNALADVLMGKANPSGKLPFTWYAELKDNGAHALDTYPGTWRPDGSRIIDEEYKEGIYVGYRWTDKQNIRPVFAFGHGLSYTQFEISDLRLADKKISKDGILKLTVSVKNTGSVAGSETVQAYVHDVKSSVDRPEKELKGFQKVSLAAGESREVTIEIPVQSLSFWDESEDGWNLEAGEFTVLVGNGSDSLPLKAKFEVR